MADYGPRSRPLPPVHLGTFLPEDIVQIVYFYVIGMSVEEITQVMGFSPREVNAILDYYTPHLDAA